VSSPAPEETTTIEVGAWDVYFDPSELHLPATGASRIVLTNHGYAAHNVTIDELGIQVVAARGRIDEVTVADIPPGPYAFYCSVSGHRLAGMEGVLIVE
jgi:plastocyanin